MKFTFAPQAKPLPGYTIKRAIHRGGFGEVYYAITDAGKEVALKLLNQHTDIELRGVTQCLNLKHPNLVTIFDIKTDEDDDHWIIMEYVSGDDLATVLAKHPNGLPMDRVEHWLTGITNGLNYLHDRGIVHRDLKPANIYSEHDMVKVGDVGLSKFITESRRNAQTQSVGTVYYMAPEVANGRYGREVDVYSLGIMLFELITGNVPFNGESAGEILMKHLSKKPDLSSLPENMRPVLARALAKDPQKRTPSATELLSEFKQALSGKAIPFDLTEESFIGQPQQPVFVTEVVPSKSPSRKNGHQTKRQRKPNRHQQPETPAPQMTTGVKWFIAVAVFVLLIISARSGGASLIVAGGRQLFVVAIFGTLAYVAYQLVKTSTDKTVSLFSGNHPPVANNNQTETKATPISKPMPSPGNSLRYQHLTPYTLRTISLRHRMTELTGSMTLAVICTGLITAGLYFFKMVSSPGEIALFGGVAVLASWGIMIFSKLTEGRSLDNLSRRILLMLVGVTVGMTAFWLKGLFHVAVGDVHNPAMFNTIGRLNLIESGAFPRQPTMAGFAVFFGILFAVRRWWVQADSFRKKRFGILSIAWTTLLAWLASCLWYFPADLAVAWSATICSVVHLSSIWVPQEDRYKLVNNQHHSAANPSPSGRG